MFSLFTHPHNRSNRMALLAILCSSVTLTACGQQQKPLDTSTASELQSVIQEAKLAFAQGKCEKASKQVAKGQTIVSSFGSSVKSDISTSLLNGFQLLEQKVQEDCDQLTTTSVTTTTEPTTSTTTTSTTTTSTTTSTTSTTTSTTTTATTATTTPSTVSTTSGGGAPIRDGAVLRAFDEALREIQNSADQVLR